MRMGVSGMTLQNMRYIVAVAQYRSVSRAAAALYMTQSALSAAVKDAEEELGIQIFVRTNRGVTLTSDGEDCLRYCQEILERADRFSARYKNRDTAHLNFSVSTQHLPFAVRAFDELLKRCMPERYNAAIYEVPTRQLIQDVSGGTSEIGILAVTEDQLRMLNKALTAADLFFTQMESLNTYVFLRREHPLGGEDSLTLAQLKAYPYVTYDASTDPIYFTEESILYEPLDRCVHVSDRATKMSVLRSSDAFSIGVDLPNFNRDIYFKNRATELIAIPFADQSAPILVGILERTRHLRSEIGQRYIELLRKHLLELSLPGTK